MSTEHNQPGSGQPGYETRDANPASLVRFGIGLALVLVVVWAGMHWLDNFYGKVQSLGPAATPFQLEEQNQNPPLPRLQVDPKEDLKLLRERQSRDLDSYGWVDRDRGIVHIPIDRAIDLVLERGMLTARGSAPAAGAAPEKQVAPEKARPVRGKGRS